MADRPLSRGTPLDHYELSRCCAEAQSDGVPCPTLGRDCQVCERAMKDDVSDAPAHPIRPVGRD